MQTAQSSFDGIDLRVLADMVGLEGVEFVNAAYERLLGRSPAEWELELWLAPLRDGSRGKLEVLGAIHHSREGSARGPRIPELAAPPQPGWIKRLPIIGPLVDWVHQLATLRRVGRRLHALETAVTGGVVSHARTADALMDRVERATEACEALNRSVRRIDDTKAEREFVQERVAALWQWAAPPGIAAGSDPPGLRDAASRQSGFGDYYRAFEDRFRGTQEQIRDRLHFYLPMLQAVAQGTPGARFVDLGCGRGELVELLRGHGLDAYGVDSSEAMVASCGAKGLGVVHGDIIAHVQSLDPDRIAGITCIHVIEHLPFLHLQALFEQCARILRPGGVAIFETPNPENIIVGACNFYYDPTHLRPLPPEPMRFMLEASGFESVVIERLHPGSPVSADSATDPITTLYSTLMSVPQDYALIGYKRVGEDGAARAVP